MARCSQVSPSVTASTVVGLPLVALQAKQPAGWGLRSGVRWRRCCAAQRAPASVLVRGGLGGGSRAPWRLRGCHQQQPDRAVCLARSCRGATDPAEQARPTRRQQGMWQRARRGTLSTQAAGAPVARQLGVDVRQLCALRERHHAVALHRCLKIGDPLLRHRASQRGDAHHHLQPAGQGQGALARWSAPSLGAERPQGRRARLQSHCSQHQGRGCVGASRTHAATPTAAEHAAELHTHVTQGAWPHAGEALETTEPQLAAAVIKKIMCLSCLLLQLQPTKQNSVHLGLPQAVGRCRAVCRCRYSSSGQRH